MLNQYLQLEANEIVCVSPLREPFVFPCDVVGNAESQFLNVVLGEGEGQYCFPALAVIRNDEVHQLVDLQNPRVYTLNSLHKTELVPFHLPVEDEDFGAANALPEGVE